MNKYYPHCYECVWGTGDQSRSPGGSERGGRGRGGGARPLRRPPARVAPPCCGRAAPPPPPLPPARGRVGGSRGSSDPHDPPRTGLVPTLSRPRPEVVPRSDLLSGVRAPVRLGSVRGPGPPSVLRGAADGARGIRTPGPASGPPPPRAGGGGRPCGGSVWGPRPPPPEISRWRGSIPLGHRGAPGAPPGGSGRELGGPRAPPPGDHTSYRPRRGIELQKLVLSPALWRRF